MTYRIIKEEELDILGKKKLFLEDVEYTWTIYVKIYRDKFEDFSLKNTIEEQIIDFNNANQDKDQLAHNYYNLEIEE